MLWDFKNEFQQTTCFQMLLQEKFKLKEKLYMKSKLSSPPLPRNIFFLLLLSRCSFFIIIIFILKLQRGKGKFIFSCGAAAGVNTKYF